jgi:hypothetical protein
MKKRFLVLYDYGQGGGWAYLLAESPDQILQAFPALRVYEKPPQWMEADDLDALSSSMTIDIDNRDHPFLAAFSKSGPGTSH